MNLIETRLFKGKTLTIPTHRWVYKNIINDIENTNGKFLVHHIDKNHLNNEPTNLQLMERGKHTTLHSDGQCRIPKDRQLYGSLKAWENIRSDPKKMQKRIDRGHELMTANWNKPEFRKMMDERRYEISSKGAEVSNKDPKAIISRMRAKIIAGIRRLAALVPETITVDNYQKWKDRVYLPGPKSHGVGCLPCNTNTILKWFDDLATPIALAVQDNHKVKQVYPVKGTQSCL